MGSPESSFYTYAYLRKGDNTPYYIGKGQKNRAFVKHEGISVPKDRCKIIFLKQNLTEEKAFKHEKYMIAVFGRKDLGTGILYNKSDGGEGVSGLILTKEQKEKRRESGKIGGKIGGKKSGNKHKENKTGVCGQSLKQLIENGKKGGTTQGNRNKENKTGIFSLSKEELRESCRKGGEIIGKKHKENKTGIFGRSPEKMSEDGRKGGKIGGTKGGKTTSSQKWQCTVTGYTSTSAGLTRYQNKRGIDTIKRIKVYGSRGWEITFEDGEIVFTTKPLRDWSKENKYSYAGLLNVRKGDTLNHRGIIKVVCL